MKMHKKLILVAAAILVVGGAGTGVVLATQPPKDSIKTSIVNQSGDESSDQISTQPTDTADVSPVAEQQPAQTNEANTPVTVNAVEQVNIEGTENIDCKLTYSDSTTFQWHWKVVSGSVTNTSGYCDDRLVGKTKDTESHTGWAENDPNWQSQCFSCNL